ncbi:hypothetical protein, partial [Pseudomonas sp. FSL R10-1339]|uniref:hypothetical protein n=1 Tax=Pseudomonas sp. FSL R10-1339 TaxID=2662196 RepID=UPI001C49BCF2
VWSSDTSIWRVFSPKRVSGFIRPLQYAPSIEVLEQISLALSASLDLFFVSQEQPALTSSNLRHDLCDIAYQADEEALREIVGAAKKILSNK